MDSVSLETIIAPLEGISVEYPSPGYPIIHIENEFASGSLAQHGAHVTSYQPKDGKPVIFTSDHAVYREDKAIRGGIPLCWPYFSAHPTKKDAPSHGIARTRSWKLRSIQSTQRGTIVVFTLPLEKGDAELVEGDFRLEASITFGSSLTVALKTTNLGKYPIDVGGAIHSYFQVGSIHNTRVIGLDKTSHFDSLTGKSSIHQGDLVITEEYDRIFIPSNATTIIEDEDNERKIVVEKQGSNATTVWNPWIKKSASMSDLGNEDYLRFLCIEAINWREDLRCIAPGKSHTLSQTISVQH